VHAEAARENAAVPAAAIFLHLHTAAHGAMSPYHDVGVVSKIREKPFGVNGGAARSIDSINQQIACLVIGRGPKREDYIFTVACDNVSIS